MDGALVRRAQEGDQDAFAALIAAQLGRLTAAARLILHDSDLADDAVQEALVDAWRDIRALRDPTRFGAWLNRLLVHACYSQSRKRRRRENRESVVGLPATAATADASRDVVAADQLERGLRALAPDQRAILVVVYYLDQPVTEAAAILGIPVGTAKSRLHRSLDALRAALDAAERRPAAGQERFA